MLWIVLGVIIAIWLAGVVSNIIGGLIHVILVIAVLIIAARFLQSRRA